VSPVRWLVTAFDGNQVEHGTPCAPSTECPSVGQETGCSLDKNVMFQGVDVAVAVGV
jgi:hypothetical protein